MKLPDWIHVRRHRQVTGTIEVTLELDTTAYVTEVERAAEGVRVMRYRERLAYERSLGLAFVGRELDRTCTDLGLDPVKVWRAPRAREEQDRRDRAMLDYRVRAMVGFAVRPPTSVFRVTGV